MFYIIKKISVAKIFTKKSKRIGIVLCFVSMITASISSYVASKYYWNCWYRPDGFYETLFFVSVIIFGIGFILLLGIPQRILAWINAGE
jgi:hypothetical protein